MNKLTLIAAALTLSATATFAQKAKVTAADNAIYLKQFDVAKENIDAALAHDKTANEVKTLLVASRVYANLALNGKDEEGVSSARKFIEKAIQINETPDSKGKTGKSTKDINKEFVTFSNNATNFGIKCFNEQKFGNAKKAFIDVIWSNEHAEGYTPERDSLIIFNVAIAAMQDKDFKTAAEYYEKSVDVNYEGPKSVIYGNYCLQQINDQESIEKLLKKGFEKYPENQDVLTSLIQFYLNAQRNEEALSYLNTAIANDPENPQFYFAKGCLEEKLDINNAIKDYETALTKNPDFFNALYNIAVVYYNMALEQKAQANNERDNVKYKKGMDEANAMFLKAVPYMKHAADVADNVDNKRQALETVKQIYYHVNDTEKYMEFKKLIDSL